MFPTLVHDCSIFLRESQGRPLYRALPSMGQGFRRVKVRRKKWNSEFIREFNQAFASEKQDILQRSVRTSGNSDRIEVPEGHELFYIFPRDGYRFMYCHNDEVTVDTYEGTLEELRRSAGHTPSELWQELLKYHYQFDNLVEGIDLGSEIVLFNIPYYYAIRKSLIEDYRIFYES